MQATGSDFDQGRLDFVSNQNQRTPPKWRDYADGIQDLLADRRGVQSGGQLPGYRAQLGQEAVGGGVGLRVGGLPGALQSGHPRPDDAGAQRQQRPRHYGAHVVV